MEHIVISYSLVIASWTYSLLEISPRSRLPRRWSVAARCRTSDRSIRTLCRGTSYEVDDLLVDVDSELDV